MGKLVLGKFVKEEVEKIESIAAKGISLPVAEHMVFGTDHAEIGALILAKWSFPVDIVNAVRWHHHPERIKQSIIQSDIVYLSNLMCQSNDDGSSANGRFEMPSSVVLKRLGIKLDQYEAMAGKTRSWMKKLSGTLTFD